MKPFIYGGRKFVRWVFRFPDRQQTGDPLDQPFSIFLPWRNPWNNFQVPGSPCIKIIISTAHGTLAWSVSCRYNNPIIIVNVLLSREWYLSVDLFILANKFKKLCLFFFQSRSLTEPIATSRGAPVEKLCSRPRVLEIFTSTSTTTVVFFASEHRHKMSTRTSCLTQCYITVSTQHKIRILICTTCFDFYLNHSQVLITIKNFNNSVNAAYCVIACALDYGAFNLYKH
jgi:hypothetical protein